MWRDSLKASLPVAFGYVPLGLAFGVLLRDIGIEWYWSLAMSALIFAGAAQFMSVALLSQKAGLTEVFVATLLLNLRHFFYGLALTERYRSLGKLKPYAIFGLTDETFSIISTSDHKGNNDGGYILRVTLLNHAWWIIGCTLGALIRSSIQFDSTGIEFSLTCLFVVLLLEQWLKFKTHTPLLLALSCGAASLLVLGGKHFLISSILAVMVTFPFATQQELK
ncbi:MAG: AzlC family ABC transporter permease [Rhodocyclaceae bacterium]|nr:AzlC family ABC transporter permease [Rhodocyclaceae bacterium]